MSKRFGTFTAIDSLDLTMEAGEFLTLLGPSGSGKTTILNILAGFLEPDSGSVLVDGQPMERVPPNRRDFGVVFQSYALFPRMTVFDNVAFPLRMRGVSRADVGERVTRALEMLHLPEQAGKLPSQLSGGQQQRVAVARAVVFEPRVVLMDEPLSALDRRLRERVQVEIKELHRAIGATVIYVTHDQGEALTMSDRIAVMSAGKVVQVDSPTMIYDRPADGFVATFVGETNRLMGHIRNVDGMSMTIQTALGVVTAAPVVTGGYRQGDAIEASIRPECIRLGASTSVPATANENRFPGRVTRVVFIGETTRYWVALTGGQVLQVASQNSGTGDAWAEADEVSIAWDSASVRILGERR